MSPGAIERACAAAGEIADRATETLRELEWYERNAALGSETERTCKQIRTIRDSHAADFDALRDYGPRSREVWARWQRANSLRTRLARDRNYQPALQHLDRLSLNPGQERRVSFDHPGAFRISGASGSGKTIILVHRAVRLAVEEPSHRTMALTVNRSLAELLAATVRALHGAHPANLDVRAFYDLALEILQLFEPRERHRLIDPRSGERIRDAWADFFGHPGDRPDQSVFAHDDVRSLIDHLRSRGADVSRYLRTEVLHIQSRYLQGERDRYVASRRFGRRIPRHWRNAFLDITRAWEEWLATGDLCDVDTVTSRAARYFQDPRALARIRSAFGAELDAVKGYEFDAVVICGLSAATFPPAGIPTVEWWRSASALYVAATRARDELILTFSGRPSPFLEAMRDGVDLHDAMNESRVRIAIGGRETTSNR